MNRGVPAVLAILSLTMPGLPPRRPVQAATGPLPDLRVDYVVPLNRQPRPPADALIFADDFDSDAPPAGRYFEYVDEHGSFVRDPTGGHGGHGGAMRARFAWGQVSAGSLKILFGRSPIRNRGLRRNETFREIYWRVYVKHEAGWEGNPAKLARATCLATDDWAQGFIAHVWGGRGPVLCIDPATGITGDRRVTTKYNDFDHLRWLGMRNGSTPIFSPAESGRWVLVESHVRINTPGRRDGAFELWVDGRLEASHDDLDWHGAWNDFAINAVFLENYWNDGALKAESRWFDDFAVATRRLGPTYASPNPTFVLNRRPGTDWQARIAADPDGRTIVWTSKIATGVTDRLRVDAAHGSFRGDGRTGDSLAGGATYWIVIRHRSAGGWSAWSPGHSPFQIPGGSSTGSDALHRREA